MKKTKAGKPKDGKQIKKVYSVRIEPRIYNKIKKQFGNLPNAIKELVKEYID